MKADDPSSAVRRQATALLEGGRQGKELVTFLQRRYSEPVVEASGFVRPAVDAIDTVEHGPLPVVRGELLVYDRDVPMIGGVIAETVAKYGGRLVDTGLVTRRVRRYLADGVQGVDFQEMVKSLQQQPFRISVNQIHPLAQWRLKGGDASAAPYGARVLPPKVGGADDGSGIRVAVIDSGMDAGGAAHHPELLGGISVPAADVDPLDVIIQPGLLDAAAGHGTFVAGVIRQVAPRAEVIVIRALSSDGIGSEVAVAQAIQSAVNRGARVINLSLGCVTVDGKPPIAIEDALADVPADVVVVASAGNNGDTAQVWPAASRRVVSVGALDADGNGCPWSSHGPWVDVSVVGQGVVSTYVEGKEDPLIVGPVADSFGAPWTAVWSGTSFAAPQVSARFAVLLGQGKSPDEAYAEITAGGVPTADYGVALPLATHPWIPVVRV
jgi:hypothetical protein